jgi:hypothetical protein
LQRGRESNRTTRQASLLAPWGIGLQDGALAIAAALASLYVPWVFHDLQFSRRQS